MTDTVNTPVEGTNTGNDAANAAPAANETATAGQPADAAAAQPHGEQEKTSATPAENTPKDGDGKVTEADKDNTSDKGAQEGSDPNQNTGFDVEKLKLPEGVTVTGEQKEAFLKDAEALGITSQEGAQRFVDWVLSKSKQYNDSVAKQQESDIGNLEKQWDEEGKKDPVLGKDYDRNVSDAMETAGQIFSPRTMEFLKDTRFEKNPDFLKDMLRLHKERADAELISGKTAIPAQRIQRDSQGNPMLKFKQQLKT